MHMPSAAARPPYCFVDSVWVDPSSERIAHLRGQFMNAWNDHHYPPHVVDADVALDLLDHRDNMVLLEEVAPGKLQPGPAFQSKMDMDAEGRASLYLPDRPVETLPLF